MAQALRLETEVGVVGAGAMGAGIAQIAAMAGHAVRVFDVQAGAAEAAVAAIRQRLDRQLEKGRLDAAAHQRAVSGLRPAAALDALSGCALVIEAIVEKLEVKRDLFRQLEAIVTTDAILATNTSSISVTLIGAVLERPQRLVGMHFFNPAPLMPLVEVIRGMATTADVADTLFATALAWGKQPVHARSTPGFIVNRVARPFYAEGLRLLQEGVAEAATLDAVMRDSGGFRMGPFELMDMIGHDVNYAVTRSVFDAYYGDPRFQPSLIQLELVNAGYLGRKSGRGFYTYGDDVPPAPVDSETARPMPQVAAITSDCELANALSARLGQSGHSMPRHAGDGWLAEAGGARLYASDGRSATRIAAETGHASVAVLDLMLDPRKASRAAVAFSLDCSPAAREAVIGLLQGAGLAVSVLADSPGLLVMRTVSMLANEACDAVLQQVCTAEGADQAMRGGVGYPVGPLQWADRIGAPVVLGVLDALSAHYGDSRYRASGYLRQRVWAGKPLRD